MKCNENKKQRILFWILLLLGISVRIAYFGQIPTGINQDEAMAAVDAHALLAYGTDRYGMHFPVHFTAWGWAQMSVLLSYLMVPFIALLGFTTVAIRLPLLLASLAGMLVLYLLAKKIAGERIALLVLFLTAINPWHMMQSRWSLDCNLFPHLFVIGCFFLLIGVQKKWYLYLSMCFFGLCFYSYGIAVYSVPLFLLVAALWLLRTRQMKFSEIVWPGCVFLLIALPELLTMFTNLVGIESIETPIFTIPYFAGTVRARDILITNFSLKQLFTNIWYTLKTSFLQLPDLFHNTIPLFGTMYHISLPFVGFGIYKTITTFAGEKDLQKRNGWFLLLLWLLTGLWVGIITKEVNVNRINIIHYPLIIFAGIGVSFIRDKFKQLYPITIIAYAVLFVAFVGTYFGAFAEESQEEYYADLLETYRFADTLPVDHIRVSTNESE